MGLVTFYPWLHLQNEARAGRFTLVPWRRGDASPKRWDSSEQAAIDKLLEPFLQAPERSIDTAVVVVVDGYGVLDDLPEDVREGFFEIQELITFAGLAAREFFSHGGYVNTANFTSIMQGFKDIDSGVLMSARRRDGLIQNYTLREAQRELRPEHVQLHDIVSIDGKILDALVDTIAGDHWEPYGLSLPVFNLANTDSDMMAQRVEVVLMVSAFERLLGSNGSARDVIDRFVSAFSVDQAEDRSEFPKIPDNKFKKVSEIRGVWMADFFALRGSLAHGHDVAAYPSIWKQREHLLLGAYSFPLLVKQKLASGDRYKLSDGDRVRIESFERLAGHENLFQEPVTDANWPWREIIGDMTFEVAVR